MLAIARSEIRASGFLVSATSHSGSNGKLVLGIGEPFVAAAIFVDGRRRNAIAAITPDIDLGRNPLNAALNGTDVSEPKMAATASGNRARYRQLAMFSFEAA